MSCQNKWESTSFYSTWVELEVEYKGNTYLKWMKKHRPTAHGFIWITSEYTNFCRFHTNINSSSFQLQIFFPQYFLSDHIDLLFFIIPYSCEVLSLLNRFPIFFLQILFFISKLHCHFARGVKWQKENEHWFLKLHGHFMANLHNSNYFMLYKTNQVVMRSPKNTWPARLDFPCLKYERKMMASFHSITREMEGTKVRQ